MLIVVIVLARVINNKTHSVRMCGWLETLACVTVPIMGQLSRDDHLCEEGTSFLEFAPPWSVEEVSRIRVRI